MNQSMKSRFFQRPATKIGWWAGALAILATLMIGVNMLGLNPFEGPSFLVTAYDLTMLTSLVLAILLGVIALSGKRERSWVVWLFMLPVLIFGGALLYAVVARLKYTDYQEIAPAPDATIERLPIIYDDDGSPDGTSALLYLLSDPRAEVLAVSVSYGEAHPQVYIQHLGWMLERYGYNAIPLAAGRDAPLAGSNSFPESVREGSNDFWGFDSGREGELSLVQDSAQLMVKTIMTSNQPVTLFISGALTNLAQALRLEPGICENIEAVYIMGGAVYVPGNLRGLMPDTDNTTAEWNIYADPLAASEAFASGLNLYLVPLDATNQILLNHKDTAAWHKGGNIADFAADIYDSRMDSWGRDEIEMWDLVTAELMMNPGHCNFIPLALEVVTAEGDSQGQIKVVDAEPNVNVCLDLDGGLIKQTLEQVFRTRE